ncbi:hypothetical protein QY97_03798 [Bacillus thermotolerans]|nr:hypothetical protein QY97_03798 [Bacillus thermotolerans]
MKKEKYPSKQAQAVRFGMPAGCSLIMRQENKNSRFFSK